MSKEKIAIISVLKPVDDIRSYHKMAKSLLKTGKYELHLIGFASQTMLVDTEDCYFHSHEPFHRLSPQRLLLPLQILWTLLKIKPKQIICNSPELLWITIKAKVLLGAKIIYDIQENYKYNLLYQKVYPSPIKQVLALSVRIMEYVCSIFFDHFVLAEKCYADELGFIENRFTVIENKSLLNKGVNIESSKIKYDLLFSGTITVSNGIFKTLDFWRNLKKHEPSLSLKVIGHCSDQKLFDGLQELNEDGLHLDISSNPIPYDRIVEAMSVSKFGLVLYELNPSNQRCLPTKVFDYLVHQLPIIFEDGASWQNYIETNSGGIAIDPLKLNTQAILEQMNLFEAVEINASSAVWDTEAKQLIDLMNTNTIKKA